MVTLHEVIWSHWVTFSWLHVTGWGKLGQEETWSRLLRKAEVSIATSGECEDNVRDSDGAGQARSCCHCFSCSTPALVLITSSPSHLVNNVKEFYLEFYLCNCRSDLCWVSGP